MFEGLVAFCTFERVRLRGAVWCAFGPRWAMALRANSANQDVWIALRVSEFYTVEIDGPGAWIATRISKPRDFPQTSITSITEIEEEDIAGDVTDIASIEALGSIEDINEMSSRGGEASGAAASGPKGSAGGAPR